MPEKKGSDEEGFYGTGKSIELSDEFSKQTKPSKADLGIVVRYILLIWKHLVGKDLDKTIVIKILMKDTFFFCLNFLWT